MFVEHLCDNESTPQTAHYQRSDCGGVGSSKQKRNTSIQNTALAARGLYFEKQ